MTEHLQDQEGNKTQNNGSDVALAANPESEQMV